MSGGPANLGGGVGYETPTGSDAMMWSGPRGRAPGPGYGAEGWGEHAAGIEAGYEPLAATVTEPFSGGWRAEGPGARSVSNAATNMANTPTLQYLKNWIQHEEDRLAGGYPCS